MKHSAPYDHPSQMEPLLPANDAALNGVALKLVHAAGALTGALHPITQRSLTALLRNMNSYYSNLIEGNRTHPRDIERALLNKLSRDGRKRALQLESRAHVEVQQLMEARLSAEPALNICGTDFLCWLHREFYERLPAELCEIKHADTGEMLKVVPGKLRENDVAVGHHLPPRWNSLPAFMDRFSAVYDPVKHSGTDALLALAASHQRLLWIHPFLDGNGRVSRLFSHAYLIRCNLDGHGLWTVARGLSRTKTDYFSYLDSADLLRQGALDGRGNLSAKGLNDFCAYFLRICVDQAEFMQTLLDVDNIEKTFRHYVELKDINSNASELLLALAQRGELARGKVKTFLGVQEVRARQILKQLTELGIVTSTTPKGPVRLAFTADAAEIIFPRLFVPD